MHSTPLKKILMDGFVDIYYTNVSILTCFTFLKLTDIFSSHVTYYSPLKNVNLTRWEFVLRNLYHDFVCKQINYYILLS